MAQKEQVQTRLAHDTKDTLTDYQDDYDLSQADALRRLTRSGLIAQGYDIPTADGGQVLERLDELEEHQNGRFEEIEHQQNVLTIGALAGLLYLAATIAFEINTVWWATIGMVTLAVVVLYRFRAR